jgi:site-specific recombinase XerD
MFTKPARRFNTPLELLPEDHRPTIAHLRDRAIVGALEYVSASVIVGLQVKDYYSVGTRRWLRIVRDGIERQCLIGVEVELLMDAYLEASGIKNDLQTPLFRSTISGSGQVSIRSVHRYHVAKLARRALNLKSIYLTKSNAEHLLNNIKPNSRENLRDRAIIGMLIYVSASPREIAKFRTSDLLENGEWCCIKLARARIVEVPKPLHVLLRDYVRAEQSPEDALLFRVDRSRAMSASNIENMIQRRLKELVSPATRRSPLHRASDSRAGNP